MRFVEFPWLALASLAACTTTTQGLARARPDLDARLPRIRSTALVALDVKEYEVSAGGVTELKEEWSAAARGAIRDALATELRSRQIELRVVDPDSDAREEIDDLRALSEAINCSASSSTTPLGSTHSCSSGDALACRPVARRCSPRSLAPEEPTSGRWR